MNHPVDVNKMVCRNEGNRWIVTMQHRIQGKWVDPLPGMDRLHATCATREDARQMVKTLLPQGPGKRFVIRKEAAT